MSEISVIPVKLYEKLFIGISGMIAAGKSTLCKELGRVMNLPVYFEEVINNEYLADFYKDPKKYAFPLQIHLLNKRFKQQQLVIWSDKGGIQDRTIYEDSVFCKMLRDDGSMSDRNYRTYIDLFRNMSNFMRKPNLIIHLDVSPEESLERLKMRNRKCEDGVPLDYLKRLHACYEEFISDIAKVIPVIKVNYSKFKTAEEMAKIIKKEWDQMSTVVEIDS